MANCKLCGHPVTTGVVIHSNCMNELLKEVIRGVCGYRCKWAMICEDKKKLSERHCPDCGMTKLMELVKGGGE